MLPVRVAGADVGRAAAGALRWAPLVGALLGAVGGALLVGLAALGVPAAGLFAVGFLALARAACTSTGSPTPRTGWAATDRRSGRWR